MNKWTSDETARFSAPCCLSTKSLTEVPSLSRLPAKVPPTSKIPSENRPPYP